MTSWQSVWRMSRASSSPRRVGLTPDDHRSREGGAGQEEEVLGHVLEQDADVEGPGTAPLLEQRGAGAGLGDDLAPRPLPALEAEPDVVVLDPSHDEVAGDEGSISGHAEAGCATRPGP